VLKASDLAGKPMVSEAGQMGYRVTDLMVDRPRAAVSYLAVSRDEDPGGRERLKLPLDRLDRVETDLIRVRGIGGQPLFLAEDSPLPLSSGKVNLLGMKVISRTGNLLGTVDDFLFSRRSGLLLVVYVQMADERVLIRCDEGFSILEDIIISNLDKRLEAWEVERLLEAAEEPPVSEPVSAPKPAASPKTVKTDQAGKADRVKTEKAKRPEKTRKAEKEKKPEKIKRAEKEKKPERIKEVEKEKKPERIKEVEKEKKPEKIEKAEREKKPEKIRKVEKEKKPEKTKKPDKTKNRAQKADRPAKAKKADEPKISDKTVGSEKSKKVKEKVRWPRRSGEKPKKTPAGRIVEKEEIEVNAQGTDLDLDTLLLSSSARNLLKRYIDE